MAVLKKGVFTKLLIGKDNAYLRDDGFLKTCVNEDKNVRASDGKGNDFINFTHKGTFVGGQKSYKNPTYPLPIVTRTNIPDRIECSPYSSPMGVLPYIDLHGLPFDERKEFLKDERALLMDDIVEEGIWNCSPYENTPKTPMIKATGPVGSNGYKLIVSADLKALRIELNKAFPRYKKAKWILLLDTESYWNLATEDKTLAAQMERKKYGDVSVTDIVYLDFKLMEEERMPYYDGTTEQRLPYASVPLIGTDLMGATAYIDKKTFASGMGKLKFFQNKDDAAYQADLVSYCIHAYVGPYSGDLQSNLTYMGAILRTP